MVLERGPLSLVSTIEELLERKSSSSGLESREYPVTGRGGLQGCEMLRIPRCLDSRLTDGGVVVSITYRPRSTPQKHFSTSGTHFC
jgi:hypothetical protein